MVTLVNHPNAQKNDWTVVGMTAALVATIILVSWYGFYAYREHMRQLRSEADAFSASIATHADAVETRVRDIAALAAAGTADSVSRGLLAHSGTNNHYMRELGYFNSKDPRHVSVLRGAGLFMPDNDPAYERLIQELDEAQGRVLATNAEDFPVLFWQLSKADLVLLRQVTNEAGEAKTVYAVVDLARMLNDEANNLNYSHLRTANLRFANRMSKVNLDTGGNWLEHMIDPVVSSDAVWFSYNLSVSADLQDRFENFRALALVIIGLCAIALAGVWLFLFYLRTQAKYGLQLQAALADAEQASEAKSTFLANMSHEIRTPLNGVLGMAELVARTELDKDQKRYIGQIKSSGQTLLAILNDILDLSKLDGGQLSLEPVSTELPELLHEIVAFHVPAAQFKGIALELLIDPGLPKKVEIDPTRLRQIVSNLLTNAIKFTEKGFVRVNVRSNETGCEASQTFIEVVVKDSGIGIADSNIRKLFSRFTQAESSTARLYGGTGLGLSICKQLCEHMGGVIGVVSELGSGSEFSFSLPVRRLENASYTKLKGQHVAIAGAGSEFGKHLEHVVSAFGIHPSVISAKDGAYEALLDLQTSQKPLTGVLIDEAGDLGRAVGLLRAMRENPATANLWCVLLADTQSATLFRDFDCVAIKPLTPAALAHAIKGAVRGGSGGLETVTETLEDDMLHPTRPSPDFSGRHVLLVDDNNVNLMFGEEILKDFGCEVCVATNGKIALEKCETERFDAILLDCQMPVMDGYEAAGVLKSRMRAGQIDQTPIIALTANALKGDREKCLDAGMDEFLPKPLKVEELEKMLSRLFSQNAIRSEKKGATKSEASKVKGNSLPAENTAAPQKGKQTGPAVAGAAKTKIPLIDVAIYSGTRAQVKQFDRLLEFYRADTRTYLDELKQSLIQRDIEKAVMPAHTIKSSSRIVGAMGVAALAENFELRARKNDPSEQPALDALRMHMERIFALTEEKLNALAAADSSAA